MTGTRHSADRINHPASWLATSMRHIRYGFSIIRQDGWVYFLKRLYQLSVWRVKGTYQSIRYKLAKPASGQLIEVADIQVIPLLNPQDIEGIPTPAGTASYHSDLVMQGIVSHKAYSLEREIIVQQGQVLFSNRSVLFVSPIRVLGGGANLIFMAVKAMRSMGVNAQILNLNVHRAWFERNYPDLNLPIIFTDVEEIPFQALNYDAAIATSNPTVSWIAPAAVKRPELAFGYYIQDYEPYFYPPGSHEFQKAFSSYTLNPNLIRMVTTPWIADQIELQHHVRSTVVGAHMDTDLFQPRPRTEPSWPDRPLRITAMIRPTTPRRNASMTMSILKQASRRQPSSVEIRLFGCDVSDPGFASLEHDFAWQLAGELRSTQVANLFNDADIFVDFSEFQALGLTALEAMASGLAVIVPANGGARIYAHHEQNCLLVDTHDREACFHALRRLIEDDDLRLRLQKNAIPAAAHFFAEIPALNMLKALFQEAK